MRTFHTLFAALMAATFVLLSQNVQAGPGWPAVYDPLQLLTLNLNMDEKDWTTVKADTTYDIEVPAMFWAAIRPCSAAVGWIAWTDQEPSEKSRP